MILTESRIGRQGNAELFRSRDFHELYAVAGLGIDFGDHADRRALFSCMTVSLAVLRYAHADRRFFERKSIEIRALLWSHYAIPCLV